MRKTLTLTLTHKKGKMGNVVKYGTNERETNLKKALAIFLFIPLAMLSLSVYPDGAPRFGRVHPVFFLQKIKSL
jgi:hypothetical protein